jgi:uncharacterized membrane protein YphA (DoxX/SURF4 family)
MTLNILPTDQPSVAYLVREATLGSSWFLALRFALFVLFVTVGAAVVTGVRPPALKPAAVFGLAGGAAALGWKAATFANEVSHGSVTVWLLVVIEEAALLSFIVGHFLVALFQFCFFANLAPCSDDSAPQG